MFKWAKDLSGAKVPEIMELPIAAGTAIEYGEVVKFTVAVGVVAIGDADQDDPYLGVAMEAHDGSTAGRQSGTLIKVSVSPTAVYELQTTGVITATGGSTTTFVDSNILPATDNIFNGGYLEVITCAADTDGAMIGKMIKITDFTGSGGTITVATQPHAFASGDTVRLHPGTLAIGSFGWDLNSDGTDINYESSGGESLQLVGADAVIKKAFYKLRLHQFGNGPAAL